MKRTSAILALLAACGGGGLGSEAVTAEEAEGPCRDSCAWELDCGQATDLDACIDQCVETVSGWYRGDALETLIDCVTAQGCDADEAACALEIEPLPIHEEYEAACRDGLAGCFEPAQVEVTCEASPNPDDPDDDVGIPRFWGSDVVEDLLVCFDEHAACDPLVSCLQGVLTAAGFGG
jgi:hypothetical protein